MTRRLSAVRRGTIALCAAALLLGVASAVTPAPARATSTWSTFAGTGTGAIADGSPDCVAGAPLVVSFAVTGMPVGPVRGVRITDLLLAHSWVGDLTVTLTAPDASNVVLFARTGALMPSVGDDSDLDGPYSFSDAPTPNDWWAEADALPDTGTIPAGRYRASTAGGAAGGGAVQPITAAFSGVTDPNGVWTLSVTDRCRGGVGRVEAVNLQLQPTAFGAGCAAYQSAVDLAAGAVSSSVTSLEAAQATLTQSSEAVGAAQMTKQEAAAGVTKAAAAVTAAATGLTVAKTRVTKAAKALKAARKARKSAHKKAKVARAAMALKVAQAKQKVAQTVLDGRQEAATTAGTVLANATQTHADRQVDRAAAVLVLTTAQVALTGSLKLQAEKERDLDQCLDA